MTNYQYASNDPVKNIDLDGLEGLCSTTDFFQAIRQGEAGLYGTEAAEKTMEYYQKGAANGAMVGISLSFSAIRLGELGISLATIKDYNSTRAAFEVLGFDMPSIINSVSNIFGGEKKGSNIVSMSLNDLGQNNLADIVDLLFGVKTLSKGVKKMNKDLIKGTISTIKGTATVLEDFTNDNTNKTQDTKVSKGSSDDNISAAETATLESTKKKVKEANEPK
jgi:hypothetical protein